jgi:hypothetical protein
MDLASQVGQRFVQRTDRCRSAQPHESAPRMAHRATAGRSGARLVPVLARPHRSTRSERMDHSPRSRCVDRFCPPWTMLASDVLNVRCNSCSSVSGNLKRWKVRPTPIASSWVPAGGFGHANHSGIRYGSTKDRRDERLPCPIKERGRPPVLPGTFTEVSNKHPQS